MATNVCKCKKCSFSTKVSRITVEENKKSATFLNDKGEFYHKIRVDGCEMTENKEKRADWRIEKVGDNSTVIIELKGKDVSQAIRQYEETAADMRKKQLAIAGLIVCSGIPQGANTQRQKAEKKWKKLGANLRFSSGNKDWRYEEFFSSLPRRKS
jgi:hypothetical protein